MNKILVVDDEEAILELIHHHLSRVGYQCSLASDGEKAIDYLENNPYDLIILDIMLPGMDGYELMAYIKPFHIPVIFLTARISIRDRLEGFTLGADDYLTKPFDPLELLARIKAVLHRCNKTETMLVFGDICIYTLSRKVIKCGELVKLTNIEYELFLLFAQNPDIALYRDTIYERVWGGMYMGDSRTIDLHVQRLRKKLGLETAIEAVFKIGYRFVWKEKNGSDETGI